MGDLIKEGPGPFDGDVSGPYPQPMGTTVRLVCAYCKESINPLVSWTKVNGEDFCNTDHYAKHAVAKVEGRQGDRRGVTTEHKNGDAVSHPTHYNSHPSGIEAITITRHHNFNVGNVIKYLWRAGLKNGETTLKDLRKAAWYLKDEIEKLEKESGK